MTDERTVLLVLGSSTGGIGRHVRHLAESLVHRGWRVTVVGPLATEQTFGFAAAGATFAPVEIPASPSPVRDLHALRRIRPLLASAAVVHAHGLRAGLLSVWARGRSARRPPVVVTWHNLVLARGPRAAVLRVLERQVARHADVTLAASSDLRDRAESLGATDARLAPVGSPPHAADGDRARARAALGVGDRPVVLAVGRLHPQKGLDVLIRAASEWAGREPAPVVLVAGDGPERARLGDLAAAGPADVRLLGARRDIPDLLAAADIVVLPSRWEARALVAQEAMAAGRPLVCTDVGGLPELVGDAALVVRPDDVRALSAAVASLLADPARAQARARAGRRRAATWPDADDTVRGVVAVYDELLASC
jgi:glycosyltransferase involved in cell wall biosynthesis